MYCIGWVFDIGSIVEIDAESVEGTNAGDKFEAINRLYDKA